MANPTQNPTIGQLAADLAAGRTTSRQLTEEALARIEDPKGEGKRAFVKVWRGAGARRRRRERRPAQGGSRPLAARRHSRSRSRTSATSRARRRSAGSTGPRRRQAGRGGRARRGAPARGRCGDRRQHQHERVRLLGRRLQPALRHAGQSRRPRSACRAAPRPAQPSRSPTAWPSPPWAPTPAAPCASRPRSAASRGLQADGAARADRRRHAALDLARLDRPARQLGRRLRHRRRRLRRRADLGTGPDAARRPALRHSQALRDGRTRRHVVATAFARACKALARPRA
jgi:hypothetical protein